MEDDTTDTIAFTEEEVVTLTKTYLRDIGADIDNLTPIEQKAVSYLNPPKIEGTYTSIIFKQDTKHILTSIRHENNFEMKYLKNIRPIYSDIRVDCPLNEELAIDLFSEHFKSTGSYSTAIVLTQKEYITCRYYTGQLSTLSNLKAREMKKYFDDTPVLVKKNEELQKQYDMLQSSYNQMLDRTIAIRDTVNILVSDITTTTPKKTIKRYETLKYILRQI